MANISVTKQMILMHCITKSFSKLPLYLAIFVLILSCAPKIQKAHIPPPPLALPIPYELRADAANGQATIYWRIDRPANMATGGYYIYLAETATDTGRLYNSAPYPGDTDGDVTRESINIQGLTDGYAYYAWIKTIMANGELGPRSEKLRFIPVEMGELKIRCDILADSSGYSFAKRKYTKARDYDNDFYLYYKGGLNISSPSLYNSGLRKTSFMAGGNFPVEKPNFKTSLPLVENREYILKSADNSIIRLRLVSAIGKPKPTEAIFKYSFYYPKEIR